MNRARLRRMIAGPLAGGGGAAVVPYEDILVDTYGAQEVWPLVDIASGTTITAHVDAARNGTLQTWALQNAAGPVTGTLAPLSDGTNDFGALYTASLAGIFSAAKGSAFMWGKVATNEWAAVNVRFLFRLGQDNNNRIQIAKAAVNTLNFLYNAGGTSKNFNVTFSSADWFSVGISWDKAGDEVKGFANGEQVGTTQTGLGTYVGGLVTGFAGVASLGNTTSNCWNGLSAYMAVKFGSIWTPTQMQAMHDAANT